jgi:nucleotide-binding universal stress UspA family protein
LIIVGSHGQRGLRRLLLGSVAEFVARHAPCSVEVVRTQPKPPSSGL